LHQGVGALELVGLPGPARVLRAAEAAVQKLLSKPGAVDEAAVQVIERASFALLDYLARVLAGKKMSPLALFPQYRDAQQLAGSDRAHPADLWEQDWRWMDLPADNAVAAEGCRRCGAGRHGDPGADLDAAARCGDLGSHERLLRRTWRGCK
jgi:chemosensory pili system protein ChpA (sensor histidine kinase/response regulator)